MEILIAFYVAAPFEAVHKNEKRVRLTRWSNIEISNLAWLRSRIAVRANVNLNKQRELFFLLLYNYGLKSFVFNLVNLMRAVRCIKRNLMSFFRRWVSFTMLLKPLMCWRDWTLTRSTGKEREGPASESFSKSSLVTSQGWTYRITALMPPGLSHKFRIGVGREGS